MILIGAHDTAQIRNSLTPSQPWTKIGGWEKKKDVNRTPCHSACTDVNTVSSFWHWFVQAHSWLKAQVVPSIE